MSQADTVGFGGEYERALVKPTMRPNVLPSTIDWSLTIWEGARREQMRRWAALPLENIISALEEMEVLAEHFGTTPRVTSSER